MNKEPTINVSHRTIVKFPMTCKIFHDLVYSSEIFGICCCWPAQQKIPICHGAHYVELPGNSHDIGARRLSEVLLEPILAFRSRITMTMSPLRSLFWAACNCCCIILNYIGNLRSCITLHNSDVRYCTGKIGSKVKRECLAVASVSDTGIASVTTWLSRIQTSVSAILPFDIGDWRKSKFLEQFDIHTKIHDYLSK